MRISDFKLAEFFIRNVCKYNHASFVDMPVDFDDARTEGQVVRGKITVGHTSKLSQTIYQIVGAYIRNFPIIAETTAIPDEEQISILNSVLAVLRDFTYSAYRDNGITGGVTSRLNRDPFVWILIRDLVCPAWQVPLENLKIIAAKSPYVDGARFVKEGDFPTLNVPEDHFLFVNLDFENQPVRSAFVFAEAIRGHGLEPAAVIHDLFAKEELRAKLVGMAKAAFLGTDAINTFITILAVIANYEDKESILLFEKNARWNSNTGIWSQAQYNGADAWWFVGLTEKMLEPARGPDWTPYEAMKPFTDELWSKVEAEKKRRGLTELPMELLLRVQSEQFHQRPDLIIQGLLSDVRVW